MQWLISNLIIDVVYKKYYIVIIIILNAVPKSIEGMLIKALIMLLKYLSVISSVLLISSKFKVFQI